MDEQVLQEDQGGGLVTPRAIPFRSASFSQVDVTSDGKYIRSPITLKPAAPFSLLNNTLPRTSKGGGSGHQRTELPEEDEQAALLPPPPSLSSSNSNKVLFEVGDPDYIDPASSEMKEVPQEGGGVVHTPPIIREESVGGQSSSEDGGGPRSSDEREELLLSPSEKARRAFQEGPKQPVVDLDDDGGGVGVVCHSNKESSLNRQSSGQSDASDEMRPPPPPPPLPSPRSSLPPPSRRYCTRRLRGPYGEMLEAEMNKVLSIRRARESGLESFIRESKSSSPSRSPPSSASGGGGGGCGIGGGGGGVGVGGSGGGRTSLLMASMDDLNLGSSPKSGRTRKISANLPVTGKEELLTYHQRTASSPSQLLYTEKRLNLDASPRGHVLAELLETERSYVESLRILVKKYMEPLKAGDLIDASLVDEIFFQIPAILSHHERLADALTSRVTDDNQSIGDVLLDTFRQNSLLECYSLFVSNWKNAKGSLKMALVSKPAFARFLESNARQHKGKLSVDSLLIMPIQRIPRYELLLKELLKHTEPTHSDHSRLMLVLEKIKKFAVHIDCASVDPSDASREIEIEGWSAGLGHLVRQDVVLLWTSSSNVRKERCLFLFADSLVLTSIKRKSTMRKTSQGGGGSVDRCKFKLLSKLPLSELRCVEEGGGGGGDQSGGAGGTGNAGGGGGSGAGSGGTGGDDMEDLKAIHKMIDLANLLKCPHANLDEVLRELAAGLKHHQSSEQDSDVLELEAAEGETLKIQFGTAEKKNSWLESFNETVTKFSRFGQPPQVTFLQALPIRKTRAGLLLSCAASLQTKVGVSDVWVANSDGYVGQICILTLHPEPAITSCNGVCNSRITCVVSVPPPADDVVGVGAGGESEWSVWLGTEDGALQVYDCSDSVRVKKNRHKVEHKAPLHSIVYYDNRVLVSLGNGDVAVYSRNPSGRGWQVNEPSWVSIGTGMNPVTRMLVVGRSIWCAVGATVKVYREGSGGTLELLQSLQMEKGVSCAATIEDDVWVALQGSSVVRLYSNITYECLFETDVAPEVSKVLAGCDDIIRQHKSACLRVTALVVAPDKTVWVGTSAGVIVTLGQGMGTTLLGHGHTGQVRFLSVSGEEEEGVVVISGGDGYEEFRSGGGVEAEGREDSTNHLLLWRVTKTTT